ncbi:uncharacterized protein LOC112530017 isoform X1 [Gallus gallus]|uniref:uncharacterized protein LOC112530017 isoform X1 n=1 Tax=Gallus gallus TaxID=9031 RepID=UPI001AE58909|nr:uncharacterized protein LOC112530017 isoform X1 [Gallus gallus]
MGQASLRPASGLRVAIATRRWPPTPLRAFLEAGSGSARRSGFLFVSVVFLPFCFRWRAPRGAAWQGSGPGVVIGRAGGHIAGWRSSWEASIHQVFLLTMEWLLDLHIHQGG